MRRRLLNFATGLSLVLLLALTSYRVVGGDGHGIAVTLGGRTSFATLSPYAIGVLSAKKWPSAERVRRIPDSKGKGPSLAWQPPLSPSSFDRLGISFTTGNLATCVQADGSALWLGPGEGQVTLPSKYAGVSAPQSCWSVYARYWPLAIAMSALPLVRLGRRVWKAERFASGLCPGCGYDLRATPMRCPECGFVPHEAAA
jgi:hypothetical protein